MNVLKKMFKAESSLLWIIAIVCIVFSIKSPVFSNPSNLLEILRQCSTSAILILGVTWVISTGEMDASFPDIAALSSMITALLIRNGMNFEMAALIAIVLCTLFGVLTSILVVKFKFQSLIATIAVSGIAKAIAAIIGKGMPLNVSNIRGSIVYKLVWGKVAGIPTLFILAVILYLICLFIQEKTVFGQHVYAIGENRQAAKEAGISEKRILSSLFVFSALFAAIGGIIMMGVLQSGQPKLGSSFFLDGFTAVFLGAVVIKLGKPNVIGTLIGSILLAILVNGLTLLGSTSFMSQIIKGVLLLLGVAIVNISKSKQKGKVGRLSYE
ncbi:MAG: ABC transporter permease [Vallitalea sp.]|jgi:ribose/xylose/arabinose/galactoside ABC-type transport system permease subunit|nr:ABC transporter permease [Vallitalea sp.]